MRKLRLMLLALFCSGLLAGCGADGTGSPSINQTGGSQGAVSQQSSGVSIGKIELPQLKRAANALYRATWDSRTIVLDLRDDNGMLPPTVSGVAVLAKIRVPDGDNDRFEDERDDDRDEHRGDDGRPVTVNAVFDAESNVYVLQLPANATAKQKLKVKVVASGYKTANGTIKIKLNTTSPTYVGVLLRRKNARGSDVISVDTITGLAVQADSATIQPNESIRLKVTGTESDNSTVIDPPAAISISPAGANVTVNSDGTYRFNSVLAGNYTVSFSVGAVTALTTISVVPPTPVDPPITGFRTGTAEGWANNVASFLSHVDATNNGFYDGGWNVAFATVEGPSTGGGIGAPGFGQGVVVGSITQAYLYLTDGLWATTYLQAAGGPPAALSATQGNGVTTTASGDFGHQVLALKFNVDFSNPPAGSTVTAGYYLPAGFGRLRLRATGTSLDGSSMAQILAQANRALGTGELPSGFTFASFNDLLVALNGSFDGGTSTTWANGHLEAPAHALTGFRTGGASDWATNVAGFLSHVDANQNGFYDGGWNVAFATVEGPATGGGIGAPGFGQGVVIGNIAQTYLYLTDGLWATMYLQGPGGPAGALSATRATA